MATESGSTSASAPRILVRANERGPAHASGHPYNPRAEIRGWLISRQAGLTRIAVNLGWLPPGRESAVFHVHYREEEWVYFLEGHGVVEMDDAEYAVGPGDFFAFPPGVAHLVRNTSQTENLSMLVGGEIIGDVEVADFPRLRRRMVRYGRRLAVYPMEAEIEFMPGITEMPAELLGVRPAAASPGRFVRATERGELRVYHHPQNPRSEVHLAWLSRPALSRISVGIASVPARRESFVQHVHRSDEEWMYVLSGHGVALIGGREEPIGPGDFLGFPVGEPSHNVRAGRDDALVYLQGGDAWSRNSIEIIDLPDLGLRKTFVGTRSSMTFPMASAIEHDAKR